MIPVNLDIISAPEVEAQSVTLPAEPTPRRPLWCARRMRSPRVRVHYPVRFKRFSFLVSAMSLAFAMHYFLTVLPTIEENPATSCQYNDQELAYTARWLFYVFIWIVTVR